MLKLLVIFNLDSRSVSSLLQNLRLLLAGLASSHARRKGCLIYQFGTYVWLLLIIVVLRHPITRIDVLQLVVGFVSISLDLVVQQFVMTSLIGHIWIRKRYLVALVQYWRLGIPIGLAVISAPINTALGRYSVGSLAAPMLAFLRLMLFQDYSLLRCRACIFLLVQKFLRFHILATIICQLSWT